MNLSVCIITKNESEKLKRCLAALKPYLKPLLPKWELVVVDTGSTDDSKSIALEYTDAVYDFAWCNDFAAAKNFAVSKAGNDLVLVLDTDEYLEPLDEAGVDELCNLLGAEVQKETQSEAQMQGEESQTSNTCSSFISSIGRIKRINGYTRNGEWCENSEYINRIFDRRTYHYEGKIHEQLVKNHTASHDTEQHDTEQHNTEQHGTEQHDTEQYDHTYLTNLVITHDGYDGTREDRLAKADRNKRLLLEELAENPADTYVLYQLGKSAFMAEEYPEAVKYFELALGYDLNPKLEYVIDMVETYGYALLQTGQVETALQFEGLLDEFGNTADFSFLMGLIYMNNELYEEAVKSFQKAASYSESRALGVNSFKAYYNAGVIRECLGDNEGALELYRKCGDYEKAKKRINNLYLFNGNL